MSCCQVTRQCSNGFFSTWRRNWRRWLYPRWRSRTFSQTETSSLSRRTFLVARKCVSSLQSFFYANVVPLGGRPCSTKGPVSACFGNWWRWHDDDWGGCSTRVNVVGMDWRIHIVFSQLFSLSIQTLTLRRLVSCITMFKKLTRDRDFSCWTETILTLEHRNPMMLVVFKWQNSSLDYWDTVTKFMMEQSIMTKVLITRWRIQGSSWFSSVNIHYSIASIQ